MNRGARTVLVLFVALAMAGGASYLVYSRLPKLPPGPAEPASDPVVVAAKALPLGALVGSSDVRVVEWPRKSPVAGAFTTTNAVVGRGLLAAVVENEPITSTKLGSPGSGSGLAPRIPVGMRAVSVRVNEVIGVAGFVVPGAHVDVLMTADFKGETTTRIVVSNLQVLTAGTLYEQEAAQDAKTAQDAKPFKPVPTTVVTLLATPENAERVALASSSGSILLALRNLLDVATTTTPGVRLAGLMAPVAQPPVKTENTGRGVVMTPRPPPPPPPAPPPPPYTVETIRGAKRAIEEVKK